MEILRRNSMTTDHGSNDYFTGTVIVTRLFQNADPARTAGASVTFEAGARTAWHTHPLGQTLLITDGIGWVQRAGGVRETVQAGDVVCFPPDEKHWHGAVATSSMTHIALQESLNGKVVQWMEHVTDEEYMG